MKAIIYTKYGSPSVLTLAEIEKPTPLGTEILVRIKATSVNSADIRLRKPDPFLVRLVFGFFKPKLPILGIVLSGVVEAVGQEVTKYKVGDEVFGLTDTMKIGTYAEYKCVSQDSAITIKPTNITFQEAAAIPFGAHTALHYLKKANLKAGQKILIYGASGSVGTNAVQLAKYYGAEVTAVCSTANLEMVKKLGADKVVDYTKQDLSTIDEVFDVVYETVNKVEVGKIAKLVKKEGILMLGDALIKEMLQGAWIAKRSNIKLIAGVAEVTAKDMDFIKELVESGKLKPVIDKTYKLEQMVEAHEYVEKGHKRGNVVVDC
jgi:NADPH:quinone reductase-like Zn-dependent oxidoreductase